MRPDHRVFGIGLRKTGARSLAAACQVLGYRTLHVHGHRSNRPVEQAEAAGLPLLTHLGAGYDAYFDLDALARRYALLDRQYPGSRFVLSTRDADDWVAALERHVRANLLRRAAGEPHGDLLRVEPDRWLAQRRRHHEAVRSHFADRRGSLLELDVCRGGQGWEALAPFLGVEVPDRPFPWEDRPALVAAEAGTDEVADRLRRRVASLAHRFGRLGADDAGPPLGAA